MDEMKVRGSNVDGSWDQSESQSSFAEQYLMRWPQRRETVNRRIMFVPVQSVIVAMVEGRIKEGDVGGQIFISHITLCCGHLTSVELLVFISTNLKIPCLLVLGFVVQRTDNSFVNSPVPTMIVEDCKSLERFSCGDVLTCYRVGQTPVMYVAVSQFGAVAFRWLSSRIPPDDQCPADGVVQYRNIAPLHPFL